MRPPTILSWLSLIAASVSARPIAYDASELVNPLTPDPPVSEYTSILQSELTSMLLLKSDYRGYDTSHDVFVIPRSHITERTLNALGYKDVVKYAKKFKYTNPLFKSQLDILVPEKTVPYFVFNTSDPLSVPKSQSRLEYANFLEGSAPFTLPDFSALTNYMLVLPIPAHFDADTLSKDILTAKSSQLPMLAHSFKAGVPLMVFLFKSGSESIESQEIHIPLIDLKSLVTKQELNSFFDAFAQTWIEDISMSQLVHGVFCTVNVATKRQSFCIKIQDDLTNLSLFPVYDGSTAKTKRDFQQITGKRVLLQKRSERLNNKMIPSANHVDDSDLIEELVIPLSIVRENHLDEDQGYFSRTKSFSSVQSKDVQTQPVVRRHLVDSDDELKQLKIEEIREHLTDRLQQKQVKDKKLRESKNTYVQSKLHPDMDKYSTQNKKPDSKHRTSNIKVKESRHGFRIPEDKASKDGQDIALEWSEKLRKEKQNRESQVKLESKASTNKNGTVTGGFSGSKDQQQKPVDCEPITWFNVFHHSVFGKTKFCGV